MAKVKKPSPDTPRPDWYTANAEVMSLPPNALGWEELHAMRDEMGKKGFRSWLDSKEFREMAKQDRKILYQGDGDLDDRNFVLITPEALRNFILSGGVDGVKAWHLDVMLALGKIKEDTPKKFNRIVKSGVLQKKSVARMFHLSVEDFRAQSLSTSLHQLDDILDNVVLLERKIERQEEELKADPTDRKLRDKLIKNRERLQDQLEPWRLAFGASFTRLVQARDVQTRLHRFHNIIPKDTMKKVLDGHSFADASSLTLLLGKMEEAYDDASMDGEGFYSLAAQFDEVVDGFMNVRSAQPEETVEERTARRIAQIEARRVKKKPSQEQPEEKPVVFPKTRGEKAMSWLSRWVPGL